MRKSYNTIAFYPEKCNGCNECIDACALVKVGTANPVHSRIKVVKDSDDSFFGLALCRQCGEPRCVMDCPAGALTKGDETGVVLWDEEKCVNCQLCTLACPYAGITHNPLANQVMKCDLCGGDNPSCAAFCPTQALEWQ